MFVHTLCNKNNVFYSPPFLLHFIRIGEPKKVHESDMARKRGEKRTKEFVRDYASEI